MSLRPRFHLAFPVTDLSATRRFYVEVLGARVGRSAARWVDLDLYGHQLSAHLVDAPISDAPTNGVDGDAVPVRHFGVILPWDRWEGLAERLRAAGTRFRIEPRIRFAGEPGEQGTFFLDDPAGNALEFKAFRSDSDVFRSEDDDGS